MSNRQQVTGALGRGPAPLVVNLRSGHVAVAEQVLHFDDVHAGVEQERGRPRTGVAVVP